MCLCCVVLCRLSCAVSLPACLAIDLRHRHVSALLLDSDDGYVPAAKRQVKSSLVRYNGNGRHRDAAKKRRFRAMQSAESSRM